MSRRYAITGVASGIGAALARKLRDEGHWVVGFDVVDASANVDQFIQLDLSDPASIATAAAATPEDLDGLCSNAGLPPRAGLEAKILNVNFLGLRSFTNALLPKMARGASIVNMASRAGHQWPQSLDQIKRLGQITQVGDLDDFVAREGIDATRCYNLSKEAVLLWTLAVAEEFVGRGLRINSLSPGGVETAIIDDFRKAFGDKMARNVARAGRCGTAEEIAEIAAFVLSPASNWLKGTDVAIDGGMVAFNMSDKLGLDALKP